MVTSTARPAGSSAIRAASGRDSAGVVADVLLPLVAEGLILRRPRVVDLLDRADAQRRAIRRVQRLDERYGPGPVPLALPGRRLAMVVSPADARTVLEGTPEVFAADTREKRAALERFEPHGVLVSSPPQRPQRRRFNEAILDTGRPVHRLGATIARTVEAEVDEILERARNEGELAWPTFATGWWRIVRRVVLGDGARDDEWITDALGRLRADANWGPFASARRELRARFLGRLQDYVMRAESGSLAGAVAAAHADASVDAVEQIPQWLFAFDAAGMASFRALALLDSHPHVATRAREEALARNDDGVDPLPVLRASVLESVRLWPTTPAILRDTTVETTWSTGVLPPGTGLILFAPYFHRDGRARGGRAWPAADAFAPDQWLEGADPPATLMPFSLGPAGCPGRDLVLLTTSVLLAQVLRRAQATQAHPRPLSETRPLPATLSPFRLRFALGGLGSGPR